MWNMVKYFITTAVPFVCLSYCRPHGSEYHYDITVSDHTKCVIPHRHTFGLLSHHGRLGGGGLRRKSPLDGATDLLSKKLQHIATVSFVSVIIVVFSISYLYWGFFLKTAGLFPNICMLEKDKG